MFLPFGSLSAVWSHAASNDTVGTPLPIVLKYTGFSEDFYLIVRRTNGLWISLVSLFALVHITKFTILPLLLCHVSHEPLRPVHSLCSWSHCGHLHGNISSFIRFCRPTKLFYFFFYPPTISDSEYYCNLCILRIFFPLASLNHSRLGSVHPWVLSSFKTYMRIFYFNQHSSY